MAFCNKGNYDAVFNLHHNMTSLSGVELKTHTFLRLLLHGSGSKLHAPATLTPWKELH